MSKNKIALYVILISIIEIAMFLIVGKEATSESDMFFLASRYSARISVLFIFSMLIWSIYKGLPSIFSNSKTRSTFKLLVILLAVNHLIHFYFLFMHYYAEGLSLVRVKSIFGFIGYLSIVLMPIYLTKKDGITKAVYRNTYIFLFINSLICIVKYAGRIFGKGDGIPADNYVLFFFATFILLLIASIVRIVKDRGFELNK